MKSNAEILMLVSALPYGEEDETPPCHHRQVPPIAKVFEKPLKMHIRQVGPFSDKRGKWGDRSACCQGVELLFSLLGLGVRFTSESIFSCFFSFCL